jgi:hypothetical protein
MWSKSISTLEFFLYIWHVDCLSCFVYTLELSTSYFVISFLILILDDILNKFMQDSSNEKRSWWSWKLIGHIPVWRCDLILFNKVLKLNFLFLERYLGLFQIFGFIITYSYIWSSTHKLESATLKRRRLLITKQVDQLHNLTNQ